MLRILIIEPHEDFGELLAELFEDAGSIATRCCATLDIDAEIEAWAPSVALVAMEILGPDDVNALRVAVPSLQYVVGMAADAWRGRNDLGCNRVLVKPFGFPALLADIRRAVGGERAN